MLIIEIDGLRKFEIAQLQDLRHLRMNWGLRPCWVESSLYEGIHFIRLFQELETLCILVTFAHHDLPAKAYKKQLKIIGGSIVFEFKLEKERDPCWILPSLRVVRSFSTTPNT